MKCNVFYLLLITVLFFSCDSNDCSLPEQTVGSGEVLMNAEIIVPSLVCEEEVSEVVIQVDSNNTCGLMVSFNGGVEEEIDFSKYTVLGNFAGGTCSVNIDRNVVRDETNKLVSYNVTVLQCGNCESYSWSENWVLIPKVPDDYEIDFSILNED